MNDVKSHLIPSQSLNQRCNALKIYMMEFMHFSTRCGTKIFETKQSDLDFEGINMGQDWAHFQHRILGIHAHSMIHKPYNIADLFY